MPKIKISKKALRGGRNLKNDWKIDFKKKHQSMLNKIGGSSDDAVAKILEIEKMSPKERYEALVKMDNEDTISSQKSLIFRLKALLGSLLSFIVTVLIVAVVYTVVNIVYKKYIEKNENYKTNNPLDLLKQSYTDLIPNIKALWFYLKNLISPVEKEVKIVKNKEVFNISSNSYTYEEAKKVCKAIGSKLATRDQVKGAFNKGAEWCNYGWTEGQYALYPTQKKTYDMLVAAGKGEECGKPGINGGYFSDPKMKFGVNCYGVKPEPDENNIEKIECSNPIISQVIDKSTGRYKMTYTCPTKPIDNGGKNGDDDNGEVDISTIDVLPFNNYQWSIKSNKSNLYIGDNSISRNINDELNSGLQPLKNISKVDLKNSLMEIDALMSNQKLIIDLKNKFGSMLKKKSVDDLWKMVASFVLVKMKSIFMKNNIETKSKESGEKIEKAIVYYDDASINALKAKVDKYLTKSGIQELVNKVVS